MSIKPAKSRSELRKDEFQKRISDAALELFTENGVNETSIISIIEKAGVAHKTFFNHFPTKNHLLFHIASSYSGSSNTIFAHFNEMDITPMEKLENSFMAIAEGLAGLPPKDIEMFKFILNGVHLGPESSKIIQRNMLDSTIGKILSEAAMKNQLQPGIALETYAEVVVNLFISTMLNWASFDDYPLVLKMRRTIDFIKHSVFL